MSTVLLNHAGSVAPHLRLLAAHCDSDHEAAAAWQAWRDSVDIEHLTWPELQVLPVLNGPRIEEWLADDPAGGVLKGIVRRAWSEAQVRLGLAREAVNCLKQAGCGSVTMIGAVGANLRSLGSTAIRPVLELRLLLSRHDLTLAGQALEAEGWQPRDKTPTGDWLDRMSNVLYNRNGTRLYLHWRVLEVEARHVAACEREFLSEHETVEAIGTEFRILSREHALLEALTDRTDTMDALAWQADAALLCREPIDWTSWSAMARRFQPSAFERLQELRAMGLDVPELRSPSGWLDRLSSGGLLDSWRQAARSWARRISASVEKA
jgi:hypothetical protein